MDKQRFTRFYIPLLVLCVSSYIPGARAIIDEGMPVGTNAETPAVGTTGSTGNTSDSLATDDHKIDISLRVPSLQSGAALNVLNVEEVSASEPVTDLSRATRPDGKKLAFKQGIDVHVGQGQVDIRGKLFADSQNASRMGSLFDESGRYRLDMFGSQTEPTVDLNSLDVNYVPASQNTGSRLQFNTSNDWQLSSGLYQSRSMNEGLQLAPDYQEAKTWNLTASRGWWRKTVTAHLEYASSRYQQQDYNREVSDDRSSAVDTRLNLASNGILDLPVIGGWRAGFMYQSVGNDFHSLGLRSLPAGLTQTQVFFETSLENVDVKLDWQDENQAALERLLLPAHQTQRRAIHLNYKPDFDTGGLIGLMFGSPSLSTDFSYASQRQEDYWIDNGYQTLLSDIDAFSVTLKFDRRHWYWSIYHREADQQDRIATTAGDAGSQTPALEWNKNSTVLELGIEPYDRLSLDMNMQWHQQYETHQANEYNQQQYEIAAHVELIPRRCRLSVRYDYGHASSALSDPNSTATNTATQYGNARLSWKLARGTASRPAMDIYIQSNYGKYDNRTLLAANEKWSAMLGFKLY